MYNDVSPEIRAMQLAYAARPYSVYWRDSHFSTLERFHTFDGAFAYAQRMWANIRERVAAMPNHESQLWRCTLETPEGEISLKYYLLADDVSSYNFR